MNIFRGETNIKIITVSIGKGNLYLDDTNGLFYNFLNLFEIESFQASYVGQTKLFNYNKLDFFRRRWDT